MLPMLFSRGFMALCLMFKSLIKFEFTFVCGMRKCSNFIDLHAAGQLSQHHFLKRMSFPHCIFLPSLAQINWPQVQVYFWAFSPVPLIHASVFVLISHGPDCCRKAPGVLLTWCCKLNPKPPSAHSYPPRYMPKKSARVHWKMFIEMYMSASVTIAPNWKQPRCPSWGKRINKLWQIPTAENHSAVIRNELLLTCKTGLDFKNITLNKRGLRKEYITYDSIYLKFKNKIRNGWWEKNTIVWGAWGGLSWGHKNVIVYDQGGSFTSMYMCKYSSTCNIYIFYYTENWGFPGGASGKELTCQCRRCKRHKLNPWVGNIPWRRPSTPLQYSCLENPMARGAWQATVHRVAKSQTRLKQINMHACI